MSAILVILITGLWLVVAGCASISPEQSAREADLKFVPIIGMRLSYQVKTTVIWSDPVDVNIPSLARENPVLAIQVGQALETRVVAAPRTIEVTAVDKDSFDIRVTVYDKTLPATFRFSRDWTLEGVVLDSERDISQADRDAITAVSTARHPSIYGRWKPGETKPFVFREGLPGDLALKSEGTVTFHRIVRVDDWLTAEFSFEGTVGVMSKRGVVDLTPRLRGSGSYDGRFWVDLTTGANLRTKAVLKWSALNVEMEELLDRANSKGLGTR